VLKIINLISVRFKALMAANMKMTIVLGYYALMKAAVSVSESSINFWQTTRSNNPEDSYLHYTF
jgi:hypothetical protein